jgi:predicted RecA/RadA family phage recombinase
MARFTDVFIQEGDTLDLPLPYDRTAGQGFLVGNIFAVAKVTALSGTVVPAVIEGVIRIDKTAAQTFAIGALVYWDDTAKSVTSVSTGNRRIGACVTTAAAGGDAQAIVYLPGTVAPTGA